MDSPPPLLRAIAAAGGAAAFRAAVGISPRTLATWRKEGVPDTRWSDVAAASLGSVTPEDLALHRAGLLSAARHEVA
jgi:DNA-binding transcriptional regulator YdaS (Cro superfamily)